MNKITDIRIGVDGVQRKLDDIRDYLIGKVQNDIDTALENKKAGLAGSDVAVVDYIKANLHSLLVSNVTNLKKWADFFDRRYPNRFRVKVGKNWKKTDLGMAVLEAFNFDNYRKNILVEVARRLNVKSCPYCNMHYTLYANEPRKRSVNKLARFQFDHFFDKAQYPMLSMSFYNLIPSCGVCNQGKSTGQLALEYNPYYSDIHWQFHFELTDPLGPYTAARVNDEIEVELVPEAGVNKKDFDKYAEMFHLKALYGRHGDVVQEVFDKAYEEPYYLNPANFGFLSDRYPDYLERLWLGNYTSPEEIEKRPMAKFMQDMWKQAKGI